MVSGGHRRRWTSPGRRRGLRTFSQAQAIRCYGQICKQGSQSRNPSRQKKIVFIERDEEYGARCAAKEADAALSSTQAAPLNVFIRNVTALGFSEEGRRALLDVGGMARRIWRTVRKACADPRSCRLQD